MIARDTLRRMGCALLACCIVAGAGCRSNQEGQDANGAAARFKKELPIAYEALLPAASGPGRLRTLTFHAQGRVYQVTDYQNNEAPIFEEGSWAFDEAQRLAVTLDTVNGVAASAPDAVVYAVEDGQLRAVEKDVRTHGNAPLVLTRKMSEGGDTALAGRLQGKTWCWTGSSSPAHGISVENSHHYQVQFLEGGKLRVRADCNSAFGTWSVSGKRIEIVISGVTKALCPPESLSDLYLRTLASAAYCWIDGNRLLIDLQGTSGTMSFAPGDGI